MGKTKWYAETQDNTQQAGFRVSHPSQGRGRGRRSAPGILYDEPAEDMPLGSLLRHLYRRLRRRWIAFCFQANRYTLGVFRRQALLKVGGLALAGYFLLFTDLGFWLLSSDPLAGMAEPTPVTEYYEEEEETTEPEGPSIEWSVEKSKETTVVNKEEAPPKPSRKHTNEAAPLGFHELPQGQSEDYIRRFAGIAVQEMKKYGIPASICLAQGLVESRSGTSKLARNNNNHFGMKCFSKKCRKGHCSNFTDDHHKDFFRIYGNPWESWRAHSQMLASGRYTRLKKYGHDYRLWAKGLQQLGYATDRAYASKLIGVIERYGLDRLDR